MQILNGQGPTAVSMTENRRFLSQRPEVLPDFCLKDKIDPVSLPGWRDRQPAVDSSVSSAKPVGRYFRKFIMIDWLLIATWGFLLYFCVRFWIAMIALLL